MGPRSFLVAFSAFALLLPPPPAPGPTKATGQQVMPDADHALAFWTSVASVFKSDPAVLFDLYNEPHDVSWSCWRNGCTSPGWQTAGMQSLVTAVRSTRATQPII